MSANRPDDSRWQGIADQLRPFLRRGPLTLTEAETEIRDAPGARLSREEIDAILEVSAGLSPPPEAEKPAKNGHHRGFSSRRSLGMEPLDDREMLSAASFLVVAGGGPIDAGQVDRFDMEIRFPAIEQRMAGGGIDLVTWHDPQGDSSGGTQSDVRVAGHRAGVPEVAYDQVWSAAEMKDFVPVDLPPAVGPQYDFGGRGSAPPSDENAVVFQAGPRFGAADFDTLIDSNGRSSPDRDAEIGLIAFVGNTLGFHKSRRQRAAHRRPRNRHRPANRRRPVGEPVGASLYWSVLPAADGDWKLWQSCDTAGNQPHPGDDRLVHLLAVDRHRN